MLSITRFATFCFLLIVSALAFPQTIAPISEIMPAVCPKQSFPEVPRAALERKISGTVVVTAQVRGGKVVDVHLVSGPRIFFPAIVAAMQKYECLYSDSPATVMQSFDFQSE